MTSSGRYRNARTPTAPMRMKTLTPLVSTAVAIVPSALQRLEGAHAPRDEQVDRHDGHGHERVGSPERQVVRDAEHVAVHDVADERLVADERRRDVVTEREREREDRPRDDAGHGERQDHAPE